MDYRENRDINYIINIVLGIGNVLIGIVLLIENTKTTLSAGSIVIVIGLVIVYSNLNLKSILKKESRQEDRSPIGFVQNESKILQTNKKK